MVSRRNYFTITVILFVVFFLFQFTNVALEVWNDYETNTYIVNMEELPDRSQVYRVGEGDSETSVTGQTETQDADYVPKDVVIYIGDKEDSVGKVVHTWVMYSKRNSRTYESLEQFENKEDEESLEQIEMIVIDPVCIHWEESREIGCLEEYLDLGIHLVFSDLPDVSVIEGNQRIRNLLGIRTVKAEESTVSGLHLYEGFLLGGETIYKSEDEEENEKRQDMELTFPWYTLGVGTKAYMKGIVEDKTVKLEEYPAVIWRKSFETAYVFAIKGSYMEDVTGLGLLSAMSAEMDHYELYPVVNAQSMILADYPGLAEENEEEMLRLYGQPISGVFRDVIWPGIIAVYQRNDLGLSFMVSPQYDYGDENLPEKARFVHYMKLINEQSAEAGLSGVNISGTPMAQKLLEDEKFVKEALPDYTFTSFYGGSLTDEEIEGALESDFLSGVRTVVKDYDGGSEVIGYQSEYVTRQSGINAGLTHTYRDDFRLKSVETALGYSNVLIDMEQVAYPGPGEDTWEDIAEDFDWNIRYYWKPFRSFSRATVSEGDEKIRKFLALDYKESRSNNRISLEIENVEGPVWFLLRTNNETIEHMEGGSWKRMEGNIYLIEAESKNVTIELKTDQYVYIFK